MPAEEGQVALGKFARNVYLQVNQSAVVVVVTSRQLGQHTTGKKGCHKEAEENGTSQGLVTVHAVQKHTRGSSARKVTRSAESL